MTTTQSIGREDQLKHILSMESTTAWLLVIDKLEYKKERVIQELLKVSPDDSALIAKLQGEYKAYDRCIHITDLFKEERK